LEKDLVSKQKEKKKKKRKGTKCFNECERMNEQGFCCASELGELERYYYFPPCSNVQGCLQGF
jgi:hypothetical protein